MTEGLDAARVAEIQNLHVFLRQLENVTHELQSQVVAQLVNGAESSSQSHLIENLVLALNPNVLPGVKPEDLISLINGNSKTCASSVIHIAENIRVANDRTQGQAQRNGASLFSALSCFSLTDASAGVRPTIVITFGRTPELWDVAASLRVTLELMMARLECVLAHVAQMFLVGSSAKERLVYFFPGDFDICPSCPLHFAHEGHPKSWPPNDLTLAAFAKEVDVFDRSGTYIASRATIAAHCANGDIVLVDQSGAIVYYMYSPSVKELITELRSRNLKNCYLLTHAYVMSRESCNFILQLYKTPSRTNRRLCFDNNLDFTRCVFRAMVDEYDHWVASCPPEWRSLEWDVMYLLAQEFVKVRGKPKLITVGRAAVYTTAFVNPRLLTRGLDLHKLTRREKEKAIENYLAEESGAASKITSPRKQRRNNRFSSLWRKERSRNSRSAMDINKSMSGESTPTPSTPTTSKKKKPRSRAVSDGHSSAADLIGDQSLFVGDLSKLTLEVAAAPQRTRSASGETPSSENADLQH